MRPGFFIVYGALWGFVLSRARATDYDTIAAMFRFADLHLFGVIGSAIATAALGFWLLRQTGSRTATGRPVELSDQPWHLGAVWGGLTFGAGWALSGACPGTSLAQIGEGKLVAWFTAAGILFGTYLYGRARSRLGATPVSVRLNEA